MVFVGIDYHKRYSVVCAVDEKGVIVREGRIEGNTEEGFKKFIGSLKGKCKVVIEAGWNWGYLYDLLEAITEVEEVVLAHPYKTRVIAEAQIKTDTLDARTLARLLRVEMIPKAHIPTRPVRNRKSILRQRLFWVRMRTRIRNRVHNILERQREINLPQMSDIFGAKGRKFLAQLALSEPDGILLKQDLAVLECVEEQIKQVEKHTDKEMKHTPAMQHILSVPGIGMILASIILTEINDIERFRSSGQLCAYAGLVPTTYASGGKEYHGSLLPMCNKWLRWAFIEAAWVSVGCSGYFGGLYRHHRNRGKGANTAIVIIARRMCQIVLSILKTNRPYYEGALVTQFPGRSQSRLAVHF